MPISSFTARLCVLFGALGLVTAVATGTNAPPTPGALGSTAPETASNPGRSCNRTLAPGTQTIQVRFQGAQYPVRVHVPDGLNARERVPLVVNLHFSNGNAETQSEYSNLDPVADAERFIVVAPNGDIPAATPNPDRIWLWNVPGVPTTAGAYPPPDARDDVAYLSKVIDEVSARSCVDDRRVYMTGHSGGGRMASAFACAVPGKIAAVAPVSGLRAGRPSLADPNVPEVQSCRPRRPVPVITFHGDADTTNPYEGSDDPRWGYTVPLAAQTWARLNGCRSGPAEQQVSENVAKFSYTGCGADTEVTLYTITGGTHSWPGSDDETATQEIDASQLIWEFFATHPKR